MRSGLLLSLCVLPLLASAQSTTSQASSRSQSQSQSQSAVLSTSFSQAVSFGTNRQQITISQPIVFTITPTLSASAGNSSQTGNSTASGTVANNSSVTSTTILATAPTNIDGGGSGGPNGGAPFPGATGAGGVYGPPDGYISAVNKLRQNVVVVALVGCMVGGALVMF